VWASRDVLRGRRRHSRRAGGRLLEVRLALSERSGGTVVTALFEAVDAAMRADSDWALHSSPGDYSGGTDYWATVLHAIPGDVLVRLAIEQGALIEDGSYWSKTADRSGVFYEDEELPDDAKPLYRMVES